MFDKSLAIVGNGPCELGRNSGAVIDAFANVVRFNNFRTDGFEIDYGKKVTHWATYAGGPRKFGESCDIQERTQSFERVYIPFPQSWSEKLSDGRPRRNAKILNFYKDRIDWIPPKIFSGIKKHVPGSPTTGILFLWWYYKVMGELRTEQVFGFSFWDGDEMMEYFEPRMTKIEIAEKRKHPHFKDGNVERRLYEKIVT